MVEKNLKKNENIGKKNSRQRHTIGLTDFFVYPLGTKFYA